MRPRIYTDTSVIGGCLDEVFREPSKRLMEAFKKGQAVLVLSELTLQELEGAPDAVKELLKDVPSQYSESVAFSDESSRLADEYLRQGVATPKTSVDAQHIAVATTARVDVLASWNFKHIVNLRRIHGYNSVNIRSGYPVLEIRSPLEVDFNEED